MGGRILYLDFDGVLHPEDVWRRPGTGPYVATPPGHVVLEHARLLADLLAPYPDVRIVLSTSWVIVYGSVRKVAHRLPDGLRARVIGATFHRDMDASLFRAMPRGLQVCADVIRRRPEAWLSLDDDGHGWPDWAKGHLVLTDPVLGIAVPAAIAGLKAGLAGMATEDARHRV
ncbi:HAD domain-containing protein [Paraburkholderia sp. EG287B]|uniref:HAD domain-containing protein n=1 Tax=Paraburkholderia sp. EG287B TaxID=3237010 RepID=UPI0034D299FE